MTRRRRVTLASIARASDVSVTTVSKVLNGHQDVSEMTRRRVEAQLRRQGYRRRPRPSSKDLIHLVVHDLTSEWAMEIVTGVAALASERGLGVVLAAGSGDRTARTEDLLGLVTRHEPVGVVLAFSDLGSALVARLGARGVPCVVIDPREDGPADVPSVGAANWAGGVAAARHLIALGHRRIAAIAGPSTTLCAMARLDGIRSALTAAELPLAEGWVRSSSFTVEAGYQHADALLSLEPTPTAIVAGNDLQALGAIQAARAHRLRIPEDLSIVGFDDLPLAALAYPALTTVRQPLRQMAYESAAIIVRMSAGDIPDPLHIDLATSLIVRDSTAPPVSAGLPRGSV
jgi:LacI family transcriptional regulator, xylobiose transport system transcriptional regulator